MSDRLLRVEKYHDQIFVLWRLVRVDTPRVEAFGFLTERLAREWAEENGWQVE